MPASRTRQEARARVLSAFTAQLDRLIPEDESVPLKGATFADFEDQVETLAQAALPGLPTVTVSMTTFARAVAPQTRIQAPATTLRIVLLNMFSPPIVARFDRPDKRNQCTRERAGIQAATRGPPIEASLARFAVAGAYPLARAALMAIGKVLGTADAAETTSPCGG